MTGFYESELPSGRNKNGSSHLRSLHPAASALLVIFSQNHNYIVNILLKINEWKRWSNPLVEHQCIVVLSAAGAMISLPDRGGAYYTHGIHGKWLDQSHTLRPQHPFSPCTSNLTTTPRGQRDCGCHRLDGFNEERIHGREKRVSRSMEASGVDSWSSIVLRGVNMNQE
ncbi:uncharacterized protein EV420DRAFT_235092 [Desarmillaria tabescens]|uniref:Uncharacterized protein n=1 Tax=Armillaria tabescens TaxID=1929756 RepID=A0AA39J5R3_ARMTA|nr:uncharacterized protein EV420DRAFT_235092 [Desarmillaria tabescens]KAK0436657.1 hypothetical protein EV420DRAFT_235092 [Desarmillaria tabescens]